MQTLPGINAHVAALGKEGPGSALGFQQNQRLSLPGMQERIEMIEGTLRLIFFPGQPTTVPAEFAAPGILPKNPLEENPANAPLLNE